MHEDTIKEYNISLSKRDGIMTCSCPDAEYRCKTGDVMRLEKNNVCKHARRLLHTIGGVLRPSEETNGTEN